jgi:hypothetical protein
LPKNEIKKGGTAMSSDHTFSKALDKAFEQDMTIDEAVAYATIALNNSQKEQTKRRWLVIGRTLAAIFIAAVFVLVAFLILPQWGMRGVGPTSTPSGQEPALTVVTHQDISLDVFSNGQTVDQVEFVTGQQRALTVVAKQNGNFSPDETRVTFTWVTCANTTFSPNDVELVNGEATTQFTPAVSGECEFRVEVKQPVDSTILKIETFRIRIVSGASPQLSIRAEISDERWSVDGGMPYSLKLYVANAGEATAENVAITIFLPEDGSVRSDRTRIEAGPILAGGGEQKFDIVLTVPYILIAAEKEISIRYQVEHDGQIQLGEPVSFVARNPQPGDIVFASNSLTITQKVTPITITILDFGGEPVRYPVSLTLIVDPADAGSVNLTNIVTSNEGKAVVEFVAGSTAVTQARLVVTSGDLIRELTLVFRPIVTNSGSGLAENSLYHRLTNDLRSQIVILPNQSVESNFDEGEPDLVNGRIVYRMAIGTPLQLLGDSREVEDKGENKLFHLVAVQFWIPSGATSVQNTSGQNLPPSYLRIVQGNSGTFDDSWNIWAGAEVPSENIDPSRVTSLRENATDVDSPDDVIVRVIDRASSTVWVLVEAYGWLAEDVIGFGE